MKAKISFAMIAGLLFVGSSLYAQAPAGAPAGTTGKCKDGTYTSQATKQGACRGHKGVDTWYASASASAPAAAPKTSAAPVTSSQAPASKAAPAPAPAASGAMPAGATGKCKDGTFTTQATKQGACRGHQGVDTWFAAAPAAAPSPAPAARQTATPPPTASQPAPAATPAPAAAKSAPPKTSSPDRPVAPGGGQGLVWVNTESNVYHCYGTQWYGKTKAGKYESEAAAKAAGARPDHGKGCGQ